MQGSGATLSELEHVHCTTAVGGKVRGRRMGSRGSGKRWIGRWVTNRKTYSDLKVCTSLSDFALCGEVAALRRPFVTKS